MTLQIGRVTGLPEPTQWTQTGDRTATVTGSYVASSLQDGLTKRDQILGLANDYDEPVVPLIMSTQTRLIGYYKVLGAAHTTDPFTMVRGNLYDYTVDLEAVPGFSNPLFESIITGGLLNNVVGAVNGDAQWFHAFPLTTVEYFGGSGVFYDRVGWDGTTRMLYGTTSAPSITAHFYLAPANYYIGAATFEQGSPYATVVGRQEVQADLVNWRLSNGLVRVTPNATAGKLDVSHWKGAAWAAAKTYRFTETLNGYLVNGFTSVTVLRNCPEETTIRLGAISSGGLGWGRINIDLGLRRGDRLVRGYLSSDSQGDWQVARDTTEAATAITYGAVTLGNIRATANDADGNRYVLISDQKAVTSDLVNGKLTQNAPSYTMDFGIGSEIGGSGSSAPERAVDIAQQYLAVQGEKQQVVVR